MEVGDVCFSRFKETREKASNLILSDSARGIVDRFEFSSFLSDDERIFIHNFLKLSQTQTHIKRLDMNNEIVYKHIDNAKKKGIFKNRPISDIISHIKNSYSSMQYRRFSDGFCTHIYGILFLYKKYGRNYEDIARRIKSIFSSGLCSGEDIEMIMNKFYNDFPLYIRIYDIIGNKSIIPNEYYDIKKSKYNNPKNHDNKNKQEELDYSPVESYDIMKVEEIQNNDPSILTSQNLLEHVDIGRGHYLNSDYIINYFNGEIHIPEYCHNMSRNFIFGRIFRKNERFQIERYCFEHHIGKNFSREENARLYHVVDEMFQKNIIKNRCISDVVHLIRLVVFRKEDIELKDNIFDMSILMTLYQICGRNYDSIARNICLDNDGYPVSGMHIEMFMQRFFCKHHMNMVYKPDYTPSHIKYIYD